MVWPIMRSLPGRDFTADLVEEVEDKADVVHHSGLFCAWGFQHGETLAVGMHVKVVDARSDVGELAGRPELRLVGAKGVAGKGVGNHHDLAVLCTIKKFL